MKRENKDRNEPKKSLKLRKQTLRQLDADELEQAGGGWYRTCMGTWAGYKYP